jgi:diguanylate cyclase (GGDEF)-like protein
MESANALSRALDDARRGFWETPGRALEVAVGCREAADAGAPLRARALILQGCVSMHRGDLRGAFALAAEAEATTGDDLTARAELAALMTHLTFFSGSYTTSLQQAERAVELADRTGDLSLRLFARRMGCLAFGNLGVPDLGERLADTLHLAIEAGERWQEALSRNDLGHHLMEHGELDAAERELNRGLALAGGTSFGLGVLLCTRAEVRVRAGRPDEALADSSAAIAHVARDSDPNPYLLGMAVLAKVQTLLALDRVEDARAAGEDAIARLGDRVPQARSMILVTMADALRSGGRFEDAYEALSRGAALEREAMQEFTELQVGLERSRLEVAAARAEAERFREQADRDFLTGLHNRRYLARAGVEGTVSLAIVDLDHFKPINDRFGHHVGDQVLVRVANLLSEHVRAEDTVVRAGGEEFVVLMPRTGAAEAAACCERLRLAVQCEPWATIAAGLEVTASVGVVSGGEGADIDGLTREADLRLYDAKRLGRDRVAS